VVQSLSELLQTVKHLGLSKCQIEDIELEAPIGEGESFTVDRCRYKSQLVAVKHVKLAALQSDSHNYYRRLRTVLAEIQIMHHAPLREHPNVLCILGYGWKTPNQSPLPYIVVEYGEHGLLRSWLKDHSRFQNMKSKLILAGDVASGVTALHLCGIVHGDLKLDNIVVVPSWDRPSNAIAKLCDFGHSIILGGTSQRQKYYGTTL
jgi:serine/threonine protein kinase